MTTRHNLLPAILVTWSIASVAECETRVLWTDFGSPNLWIAEADGADPQPLVDAFSNLYGVDVDTVHRKIYLADTGGFDGIGSQPAIVRMDYDGSDIEVLVTGGRPSDVAVDPAGGKVYWTDWAQSPNVWRADLDGSDPEVLISETFSAPFGIDIDVVHGKIYIADRGGVGSGSTPSIAKADLDGTNLEILRFGGRPTNIAADPQGGKVYWTDIEGSNDVWRADLDGSNAEVLITGQFEYAYGIALDAEHGYLYVAETGSPAPVRGGGIIVRARLDGTDIQTIGASEKPTDVIVFEICEGDVDGDLTIGFDDLNLVLSAWGRASGDVGFFAEADLDSSGVIDFDDLNLVLAHWGETCEVPSAVTDN